MTTRPTDNTPQLQHTRSQQRPPERGSSSTCRRLYSPAGVTWQIETSMQRHERHVRDKQLEIKLNTQHRALYASTPEPLMPVPKCINAESRVKFSLVIFKISH